MANTPLSPIVRTDRGRIAQLELGVGENQFARASDVNQVINYLNDRSSVNKGTVTQASSITNGVTLNAKAGTITMFATSIVTGTSVAFTLTNSFISASSIVLAIVSGIGAAGSAPTVAAVVPSAGTAQITVANNSSTATGANSVKVSFIVL